MSGHFGELLDRASMLVTVGSGGTGKTTAAAALGLAAAMRGRPASVLTIDPARRLAEAIGVKDLGNEEVVLTVDHLRTLGVEVKAPLRVMMLDGKRAWDELLERAAPPRLNKALRSNRLYAALSTTLAGNQEYIAMEKVMELRDRHPEDLLVLDTPPMSHAIDFFEAPERLLAFFDSEAARWLMEQEPPALGRRLGRKLVGVGSAVLMRLLGRVVGAGTVEQLGELLRGLGDLNASFTKRARATKVLLADPGTHFVLVVSPVLERIREAERFLAELRRRKLDVTAALLNGVQSPLTSAELEAAARLPALLRAAYTETQNELGVLAKKSLDGRARLSALGVPVHSLPRLDHEVRDLPTLALLSAHILHEGALAP